MNEAGTNPNWEEITRAMKIALELSGDQRAAYLARQSPAVRAEVESLLDAHRRSPDFLGGETRSMAVPRSEDSRKGLTPGTQIGPYRIESLIGQGGMGAVYRAVDTKLNRPAAIKFLFEDLADTAARRRFQREAQMASSLNHPHIVTVYDTGDFEERQYLVTEFVDGGTLRDWLRAEKRGWRQIVELLLGVADGLAAAHQAGIVHRDIKPDNILVGTNGYAKLADFGLAKLEERRALESATVSLVTRPGMILGTISYMSPEQASGQPVDSRSDIFSFGVVLYELLAGRRPFEGATDMEVLQTIVHGAAPPLGAAVPLPLRMVVEKATEKAPPERYQSMRELVVDLRRVARQSGEVTAPERKIPSGARRWKAIAAFTVAAAALLVAGYFYLHRTPQFTDKDTMVLADFTNTTGDPVFDGTLRQGLAVQLEQSPHLRLVSEERIQQTLSLMSQPADARLTPALAREICQRISRAAVLEGSIASLGSQYVLGLRARNCRTGDVLDDEQVQAARKEDVLNALSQIATRFRTRVGESLSTIKQHDTPLEEATTRSLEALKAYSTGRKVSASTGSGAGVPLLKRAIELDPQFAMAHAFLGRLYGDIGESLLSAESTTKAFQLRDRASDAERFFISAGYEWTVTGNLEKAQQTCELWAQTYPRDMNPHMELSAFITQGTGQYEKSMEEAKKALELDPEVFPIYTNLAYAYIFLERLNEAEATLRRAVEYKLEVPDILILEYEVAFLKDDRAGMERALARARDNAGTEDWISAEHAFSLAHSGRLREARSLLRHSVDVAQRAGERERAAQYLAGAAVLEGFFANSAEARQLSMAALALSKGRDVEYGAALALALAHSGDSAKSEALATELESRFPEDTFVKFSYLPVLRALLALNDNAPSKAIELLQIAAPYELGTPSTTQFGFFGAMYPVYARGNAYLAAHQGAEAVKEFQKILGHPGILFNDPIGALARLQLGRAFALSGDPAKAKTAYQDFFTLWKDTDDPGIPLLKQAKAEYAQL